jgi:hypothetical protein
MSTIGSWLYFAKTMSSGGTLTGEIDLSNAWGSVYLEIPTLTSSPGDMYIKAAATTGGTFRRVRHPSINSSTVTTNLFTIASACTNCIVPVPNGLRFLKVETDNTVADGCVFRVICGN